MRILVAPDAFKGAADARTVALAMARGARRAGAEVTVAIMADGW
jgi:glycerate kinase